APGSLGESVNASVTLCGGKVTVHGKAVEPFKFNRPISNVMVISQSSLFSTKKWVTSPSRRVLTLTALVSGAKVVGLPVEGAVAANPKSPSTSTQTPHVSSRLAQCATVANALNMVALSICISGNNGGVFTTHRNKSVLCR